MLNVTDPGPVWSCQLSHPNHYHVFGTAVVTCVPTFSLTYRLEALEARLAGHGYINQKSGILVILNKFLGCDCVVLLMKLKESLRLFEANKESLIILVIYLFWSISKFNTCVRGKLRNYKI